MRRLSLSYLTHFNYDYLIYKVESVCVCVRYRNPHHWTNPHQIWYGGLTLQGPGHRLCFGPRGGPPGTGGPKQGLESIYSWNRETRKKIYKTKVVGKICFSGGGSYFWARHLDPEGPGPHVLLDLFQANFNIQNVQYSFPVVNLVCISK
jgi:hypothetical protein